MLTLCWTLATLTLGCDDTVLPISDPEPCVCGDDGSLCDDTWCSYRLSLDANCLGEFEKAEVLIDGYLEPELLTFAAAEEGGAMVPVSVTPCTRTAPGLKTRIDVFAGNWAWSRANNVCDVEGEIKEIFFGCEQQ